MPVNRRLIFLAIAALILAFFTNQVINLAQASMHSGLRAGGAEPAAAPAMIPKVITTATTVETATESSQSKKVLEEAYEAEEGRPLEQKEFSLFLNIASSLAVAAAAFFLFRRTKLK